MELVTRVGVKPRKVEKGVLADTKSDGIGL